MILPAVDCCTHISEIPKHFSASVYVNRDSKGLMLVVGWKKAGMMIVMSNDNNLSNQQNIIESYFSI